MPAKWEIELRRRAQTDFPKTFDPAAPRPLVVAVHVLLELAWPDIEPTRLTRFLGRWVNDVRYLREVAKGGLRYYPDGSVDGEINPADRAHAATKLAQLAERMELALQECERASAEFRERRHARNLALYREQIARIREARQARKHSRVAVSPDAQKEGQIWASQVNPDALSGNTPTTLGQGYGKVNPGRPASQEIRTATGVPSPRPADPSKVPAVPARPTAMSAAFEKAKFGLSQPTPEIPHIHLTSSTIETRSGRKRNLRTVQVVARKKPVFRQYPY